MSSQSASSATLICLSPPWILRSFPSSLPALKAMSKAVDENLTVLTLGFGRWCFFEHWISRIFLNFSSPEGIETASRGRATIFSFKRLPQTATRTAEGLVRCWSS